MARNETPADAPTLQAAWHAYHEHDGSLSALIVSLLTSDSFLYRTAVPHASRNPECRGIRPSSFVIPMILSRLPRRV